MTGGVVVLKVPTVVRITAPGIQGRPGVDGGGSSSSGSISAPVVDGDELDVTIASNWGIDPSGNPYYNAAGAAPADAAIATLGSDGRIHLTDTRGGAPIVVAVTSVNGHTGASVVLVKGDLGLGSVDNTPDTGKPVSTAQQTALNLKANTASLATVATTGAYADLTGKPTIPSAALAVALAVIFGA